MCTLQEQLIILALANEYLLQMLKMLQNVKCLFLIKHNFFIMSVMRD